uniref:Hemicentin 1 n=1 Tax=Sparus aurata TaxID=8175 RepID=A0A671W9G0_SPAAU
MGSTLVLLSLALSVAFSAGQDSGPGATKEDIPEGASTLAFVFDVTGSMYDDLVQVIEGASKILETSLSRPKRPLYNFALVPFHDPEIGPVTITTDPKKFQYELRELYVQGGGDCPEMSVGAIKIALEISLPGSFIYVFTDARSKDYKLTHEVLQLIQQKQSQVVFVLTGDCDDRTHIGYKAYEEIASTSSGQVFHLDKKQVNEVLKWVEEAVQSSKVHLLSTDHFSGVSNTWQMPFDPSLKEVTVALSGPAPNIEIINPQGKRSVTSDGLTELLHIPNSAKVVNIKDPQPGMWSIKTSSEGRHSVRISGLSTIDFRAGFSRKPTMDFKKTFSRPVQGIPTHILLNTTGLLPPARADRLELLSITGVVIKTLPIRYYPGRQPYSLWNITEFIPPNEAFFLRVTGYDLDGFLFQRVSSVSFSSIIPDAPKVLMPAKSPGYYLQRGAVRCQADSLIPFTLRFSREGRRLGVDQLFSESANASWEIPQVTLKDEGYYECIAISSAGTGRVSGQFVPPPAITVEGNVTVSPGSRAVLTCHVVSTVNFNLTWLRGGYDARLDPGVQVLTNLSLQMSSVTPDHSGWYECIAINEGGVTAERIYLTVQEVPRVSVEPRNQTFTTGEDARIRCSASGYPPPRLVWTHNDIHRMTPDGTLIIRNLEKKDGGVYGCLASNQAGTDTMTSILTYIGECHRAHPSIHPLAVFLRSSSLLDVDMLGGTLTIKETQDVDAGAYSCVAVNAAGTSSGEISLDVGAVPKFTREPSDVAVEIGSNVTLVCLVQGHPEPQVNWRREDGLPLHNRHRAHGTVTQSLWVEDEAIYVCEAHNHFGKIEAQAKITVTGLVLPVIAMSPTMLNVIEDQQVTLPCVLLAGNPLPERQWLHDYSLYVTVRKDGSLHIERVQLDDAGDYTCLAENVVGATNHTTSITVYVIPTIQYGPQVFSTIEGTPITLPCRASGVPTPEITWAKVCTGNLVYVGGPAFSLDSDGSLLITSPSGNETGEFICTATNAAGYASRKVQLTLCKTQTVIAICVCAPSRHTQLPSGSMKILETRVSDSGLYVCVASNIAGNLTQSIELSVLVPPRIQAGPRVMKVQVGHPVELPCMVRGVPEPTLTWAKNGQRYPVSPDGSLALRNVGLNDEGTYTCTAISIAGRDEARVQLLILEPPFNSPLQERVANQRIAFPCPAKGLPKPVIRWLRNGQELTGNEPGVSILEDGTLLILASVSPLDNGEYVCAAVNDAGSTERKYQLKVNVPPDFRDGETPENVSLVLSQSTSLVCDVTGSPTPVVTWYKDGTPVGDPNLEVTDKGQVLKIKSARLGDKARYQCSVMNTAGKQSKDFNLSVYGELPPSIKGGNITTEVTALLDTVLTLECEARGVPLPTITWYRNGEAILSNRQAQYMERGHYLKIPRAQASDAGQYTCKVTSVAGSAEKTYELDVYLPPTIAGGDDWPTERKVVLSKPLILECEAEGHPPPSLTWLKDGVPVRDGESVRVLEQGVKIEILSATVSDSGRYVCVATSIAGEKEVKYDVRVLVPPFIDGADDMTDSTVIMNSPLELECQATGIPAPVITWYKDGKPVRQGEGLRVAASGRRLVVSRAQVSDTARFQCVATNEAGDHERDFNVVVQVPPSIRTTGPAERSVVLHKSISLECISSGIPPPSITWLKDDGRPLTSAAGVTMLKRGQVLEIERAQLSDAGIYRCVAINLAGVAEISHSLQVFVPPVISSRGGTVTVVVNEPARLECEATGVPLPSLTWLKDGSPVASVSHGIQVLSGGRVLSLNSALVSDTGRYTCVAVNAGGEQQREYDLRVYVPPNIKGEEVNATVMLSRPVELHCQSDAIPPPTLSWRKDGRPLFRKPGLTVSVDGSVLKIDSAQVQDSGRYSCEATNVAGKTEKNYNLNVWVRPSIRLSEGDSDDIAVTKGGDVTLQCAAEGVPQPAVTWLKDGRPITGQHGAKVLNEGRLLQIKDAKVSDTGRYTCIAVNVAGQTDSNFLSAPLTLFPVPPSIIGQVEVPENVSVVVKNPVALSCEASGIPLPAITWLKDGRPIKASSSVRNPVPEIKWLKDGQLLVPDRRHQVLSHGRFLQISLAQVSDTGRYSCQASNSAGDRSRHFNLNVLVSPSIAGSGPDGSAEEVTVTLSSPTSLVCEVQSYPPALITWLKDGTPFESSRNVRVLPGGRTLQILNAKEEDAGRYTCVATNEAGETLKHYEVKVYVPPQINKNDIPGEGLAPKEVKIKVNSTLTLECAAQAFPTPALEWYKDGQILRADDHVSITANGRIVQIKHAQVSDTGRYTCVATNIAGEDEKDFDVNIQVPPNFNRPGGFGDTTSSPGFGGDARDVILNNPISLYCETNAVPPPTLTWYKDGQLMTSNDKVLILPGGRVLQIPRAQADDSGRYTCVAVNEAGEDSIQYDVRVLLPPVIRGADSDLPDEVTVFVNKTTQLECHADGNPAPKITWFKDSQSVFLPDSLSLHLSNHQVLTAQVSDTGRYVCVADNVAGSAEKSFNLNVHVPPTIIGLNPETVTVVVNNFVSLSCEAVGFPPPSLSWLNDRGPIQANTNALIMPGGRTLQIMKAKVSDGGKYSCVAMNAAGEAYKHIYLTVFVPPSIRDSSGDSPVVVNVLVGKSVTLECESNAVPPPTITWYKNEFPLEYLRYHIKNLKTHKTYNISNNAQHLDYNIKGNLCRLSLSLSLVPPSIDGPAEESVVETISNPVTLACDATGIPPPSLIWLKNGRSIGIYEYSFSGYSKDCAKTPNCLLVPPSISGAELPSEMGVLLNESIQLVCRARGTPTPTIQWLKDGEVITNVRNTGPDGSTLTVTGAHTTDSGKYTCVATNTAGEEDRIFNLNVYVPPVIDGNSDTVEQLTTVLDSSVNIECVATGSPPPQLNWLRNGLPLPVSSHIRLLSAGQVLRITRTQVSDSGTYTCIASNRAGVDNRHYNLQVHVPPGLDGAGSTEDVTVVRGNLASLLCIADGTPTPTVSWLKEGVTLTPDPHLKLLNLNTTVQIIQAQVNDTGRYTCVANNTAGQASRHFNLKVLDPPSINGSGVPAEVSVVVNNVLELHCEASGIPAPSLTWLKDGRPLPQTNSLRLLRGGEVLRVDTGRYSCLANSPAGDDDKEFLVRVHVPPNIAGESTPQDVSVLQNRQVTLECKSDAVPPPTLAWLKDGQPLQASARVRILSGGRYLQINMAELGDKAQYTCVASNIAGKTTRQFNLAVNVAPTIMEGPQTVSVHNNKPAVLECIVSGVPPPRVTWRKHGAILAGNSPRYTFAEDGSLHIHSAQVTDTGRYLCMATNEAGTQRKRVDLQVYVPPSIADSRTNVTVTVNVQTTLSCEATGIPKPTVNWMKNGRAINTDQNQNMYRLLSSGSLVIIAPTVEDTAVYECVVSNEAGNDSRSINLTVHVPPSIADEPTELVATRLSPVVIACTASGVPEPTIHWSKDGMRLLKEGAGYMLPNGSLQISKASVSDSGTYICVAQNPAGTALGKTKLRVQEQPTVYYILSETRQYLAPVDSSVTLQCQADGSPLPSVIWHKDGQSLIESKGLCNDLILSSSSLTRYQPDDAGSYTCIATNSVGQDSRTVTLSVHTHPVFTELLGDVALNKGERLLLACGVSGIPPPKITWAFNNNIIPGIHQDLQVSKDDSGTYTCVAENNVGTIKSLGFVYVKEPPIIDGDLHSNRIEPLGGNAILNCEVRGDPLPTIRWSKNGINIQINNRIRQLDNGSLAIYGTVSEDAGNYMCVATNDAGVLERSVMLTLQSAPTIIVEPADTVVDAGTTVVLNCQAEGEPTPMVEWSRQGRPLLGNDRFSTLSNGSLRISSAQKEDTAEYECVARNLLGSVLVRVILTVRGGPQKARGSIIGNINDIEFGIAILNATITDSKTGGRIIKATITNVPRTLGPAMRKLISILNPIYWTTAQEVGEAVNGYTLTGGIFRRETQVEFATGEILRMTHIARGLDSDGALLLDIVVNGHILQILCLTCTLCWTQDYTEDYIQTGPGQLYALSTRMFSIDRESVPYSWNHTISYDLSKGKMPYLVEMLHATAISALYHPLEEILEYSIQARDRSNQCPQGFTLVSAGPFCADENECEVGNPCSHACHNAMGTYYCSCPRGLTISADGRTCQDIDECSLGGNVCHDGQDCENTIGSYRCVMRCGRGFRRTVDGLSCTDIDECRDGTHQCRYNQICENTRGSYHCTCPRGYRSQGVGRPCVDINECERLPQPCAHQCINTPGSFKCTCPPGRHLLGDGKSCAGLERLPSYESYSYGYRSSQSSSERSYHRSRRDTSINSSQQGFLACQQGFESRGGPCFDINECEVRDACQHECMNTPGSHRCLCPTGYRLMTNGKTCQDVDECLEQNIQCGANRMCFNMRGSYQCIDTPCPPNYQRDPCALSPYALEYKLLSLPFGIAANQDLIRLVAYTQDGVMHPRTSFLVVDEDVTLPFALRDENLKGVLFTTRALREPHTYRMKVRALSYSEDGGIEYQTTFIVYIAVSAYPY